MVLGKSDATLPTPSTPGVWAVSHHELGRLKSDAEAATATVDDPDRIVTDVYFCWTLPAQSAFVTGDFNCWEVTVPMKKIDTRDGEVWIASKALPPGTCQYKFIIDNHWRHAEDQPIIFDERGIINNCLTVTVDLCGELTCFCSSFARNLPTSPIAADSDDSLKQVMTPGTVKTFQNSTGVAYSYVERDADNTMKKSFMHKEVNSQPFDVVVVNVKNIKNCQRALPKDGLVSRASSFDDLSKKRPFRYDPNIAVFKNATYEAALKADEVGSMPHTAPSCAMLFANDPKELAHSVRARLSTPMLGFNPKECHSGILLYEKNHCAIREEAKGLYKSVRSLLPVQEERAVYFEMFIAKQERGGGVCVGLSTRELPLSCLVGTRPNSIGYSTSGNLIKTIEGKESWTSYGKSLSEGGTVGCLTYLTRVKSEPDPVIKAKLTFYADGEKCGDVEYCFMGDLQIFPTLSLFSRDGRVFSLFGVNDMIHADLLPKDVEIYALDGQEVNRQPERSPSVVDENTEGVR